MHPKKPKPEVWQRGPVEHVPALLQPVAHALLQAKEEVDALMETFDEQLLWQRPAGLASPAFHLQHMAGVIDRLFTYAKGQQLQPGQLAYLQEEGLALPGISRDSLVGHFRDTVARAVMDLTNIDELLLTEARGVGRARIPSTVIGLLVHTAEHVMRHTGQLMVTVKVLQGFPGK